ncbi:MAG TPA: PDDEXK nuclease domain-containing protein [Burkholderiaceae bacterium]|jgi:predicted nuclease of restriction endonuclease-like (RecB) superfamily
MKKQMPNNSTPTDASSDEGLLYVRLRELIQSARNSVARGVDLIQVRTNFEIGRHIVEFEQKGQQRAAYGKVVLTRLAARLALEFGAGFSATNLKLMRQFYLLHTDRIGQTLSDSSPQHTKGQTLSDLLQQHPSQRQAAASSFALSWSHHVFLMGVKNLEERSFYEIEAAEQGWTLRELKRQFESALYERLAVSRDKAGIRRLAREGLVVSQASDLLKEPLVLEFLGLEERASFSESDLEAAIINEIGRFLLELGKGFLFEARQKRFTFDGDHFFVDLVFYNRLLRCYVLIDLKLGKLTHQDLGQMQMYVNYFDRHVRRDGENATVGIVLCKRKNEALVEITLPKDANIHAREYQLYLPSKEELREKLAGLAA